MSPLDSQEPSTSPAARFQQIVAACDAFEAEWRAGRAPRIEDHLDRNPGLDRESLFQELLNLETETGTETETGPRLVLTAIGCLGSWAN